MGCDIHPIVQRRNGETWETLDLPLPIARNLNHRNYTLFGILAGVRDDGVKPICEPRGLPDDLILNNDDGVAMPDGETAWLGDHSHSWLLLSEITGYDWAQRARRRGLVHHRDFWWWNRYSRAELADPDSYCAGASGASVVIVSDEQGQELPMPERGADTIGGTYVQCEWEVTAARGAGAFYTTALPLLVELAAGDLDSVRLVFGFDS